MLLATLLMPLQGQQAFKVKWNANSESDIAGYKVYLGTKSGQYPDVRDVGNQLSTVISGLVPDKRYFLAVQAYSTSGLASQLSVEVSFVTIPEIGVKNAAGGTLIDGVASVSFGGVSIGAGDANREFTVLSLGTGPLSDLAVEISGANAGDFSADFATGGTLAAGASATLRVSFSPGAMGPREAVLRIWSDDADESPFDIVLSGNGGTPSGLFGTWAAAGGLSGSAALLGATPFYDGVSNLLKYAFNLDANRADVRRLTKGTGTAGLPVFEVEVVGDQKWFRAEFIRRLGSGLVYVPKVSSNLVSYGVMTGESTVTRINDSWERVVLRQSVNTTQTPKLFGRVDVTMPDVSVSPEIAVSSPAVIDFGSASVQGSLLSRTVWISNLGTDYLTDLSVAIIGAQEADFVISGSLPSLLAPGASAAVQVAFNPTVRGQRSTTLRIQSNDTDESNYEIALTGIGASPAELFESWTGDHGLTALNSSASGTPFHDGIPNLLKYAFNMSGSGPDLRSAGQGDAGLPAFGLLGGQGDRSFEVEYLRRKNSGLIYSPKISSDLRNFTPMTGTTSVTAIDDEWDRVTVRMPIQADTGKLFGRVDVTLP